LADLPREWESIYTQANLLFHEKDLSRSLALTQTILSSLPNQVEALELKALILKSQGNTKEAKETYFHLINVVQQLQQIDKEGLYSFEVGNIAFQEGNFPQATEYLNQAIKLEKNKEASHFLLGKILFSQKHWAESREHFEESYRSKSFATVSAFYIGESYRLENRNQEAITAYSKARDLASTSVAEGNFTNPESKTISTQILSNAEKQLGALEQNQKHWIKEVGISSSYDSNVLFFPNESDGGNSSSASSFKQSLNWRIKYGAAATENIRYLGAYEGAINFNANKATEPGQFFVHDLSNYFIKNSIREHQYGLKIGATAIFNYQTNAFKPFIASGNLGPFFKTDLSKKWAWGIETFFQPVKFFQDSLTDTSSRRSGWEQMVRTYIANTQKHPYWTPGVFLTGTLLRPQGSEFRGTRVNLDFTNSMYISETIFFSQSAGLSAATFSERTNGTRTDQGASVMLGGGYQLLSNLILSAQVDYRKNLSSDPNFRFSRWTGSLSGTYRL
jgi:tetratricopeptide (TPR) repeat protein